jgi:hypothetical protein
MATTAIYGKLEKPELGGGKLVIQTGTFSFATATTTSGNLASQIKTLLHSEFQAKHPSAITKGSGSVVRVTTVSTTLGVVCKKVGSAIVRDWTYLLMGY